MEAVTYGYVFRRPEDELLVYENLWPLCMELAAEHGWSPRGTRAPDGDWRLKHSQLVEDFRPGSTAWDPENYVDPWGQQVAAEDATSLAVALDRGIRDIPDRSTLGRMDPGEIEQTETDIVRSSDEQVRMFERLVGRLHPGRLRSSVGPRARREADRDFQARIKILQWRILTREKTAARADHLMSGPIKGDVVRLAAFASRGAFTIDRG